MTPEALREHVIQACVEIQINSGRTIIDIHGDTCPIGDLEGFDSLNAVEVASLLTENLGYDVKPTLLLPASPGECLTINEIINRLYLKIGALRG